MRLSFIEFEGFRGALEPVRVDIPPGFLVVTGRNGSGKSTICDAIEFALTGKLSKYEESRERGESVDDYLWWRGTGTAHNKFVRLGISNADGNEVTITRTPTNVEIAPNGLISDLLCSLPGGEDDRIVDLCRTSIIRDETLAAFSVDLKESKRFAFVRTALGTDALEAISKADSSTQAALRAKLAKAEQNYLAARDRVTSLLTKISAAKAELTSSPVVEQSTTALARLLGSDEVESSVLSQLAKNRIAMLRGRIEEASRIAQEAGLLRAEKLEAESVDALNTEKQAAQLLAELDGEASEIARQLAGRSDQLLANESILPRTAALAALLEAGSFLGRSNDKCPLCLSPVSEDEFRKAIHELRDTISASDRALAAVRQEVQALDIQAKNLEARRAQLRVDYANQQERRKFLETQITHLRDRARNIGIEISPALEASPIDAALASFDTELHRIEAAAASVESAIRVDSLIVAEQELSAAQLESEKAEAIWRTLETASQLLVSLNHGLRRAVGELVEERLASLAPLLRELYDRLRPHLEWDEIHYHLRGDVQRFLSLRVGEDINPKYTFSSGQRRAMGLAFLLAVHLSRSWCKLKTLVLDDPIQHVDDFRALHFVEVLSAIRQSGQQVICIAEDDDMARLIARRLRNGEEREGAFVKMEYAFNRGIRVESVEIVAEPTRDLLHFA